MSCRNAVNPIRNGRTAGSAANTPPPTDNNPTTMNLRTRLALMNPPALVPQLLAQAFLSESEYSLPVSAISPVQTFHPSKHPTSLAKTPRAPVHLLFADHETAIAISRTPTPAVQYSNTIASRRAPDCPDAPTISTPLSAALGTPPR